MRLYPLLTRFITLLLVAIFVIFNSGYLLTSFAELSLGRFDGDFEHYYGSALQFRNGNNPYRSPLNTSLIEHGIIPSTLALRATNPPALVLLSVPISYLDPLTAFWTWNALQLVVFILGAIAFMKSIGAPPPGGHVFIGIVATCCSYPVLFHIRHGQTQLLITGIFMLALATIRRRPHLAHFLLGVTGSIKLFTLPLALVAARHSFRKSPFQPTYLVIFFVGLLILPALAEVCSDEWIHKTYMTDTIPYIRDFHFTSSQGVSLSFLLFALMNGVLTPQLTIPQIPVSIAVIATLVILVIYEILRNRNPYDPIKGALFTITACILCSPVAWAHYVVLLYPALIYLWHESKTTLSLSPSTVVILFLMVGTTTGYTPTIPIFSTFWGPLIMFAILFLLTRRSSEHVLFDRTITATLERSD
ncbi:MAG: glycosyltransferase family 87 protein [Bdellovibrionota bacterium]